MSKGREVASVPMVHVNYEIPKELHKRLKYMAYVKETTVKAIVIEALDRGLTELEKETNK